MGTIALDGRSDGRCQFCGDVLNENQSVTCSREPCRKEAKKERRRRRKTQTNPDQQRKRVDDGRPWDFPAELEYLDQDPGLTIEQMMLVPRDPMLRRLALTKRTARWERLRERQRQML